MEIALGGAHIKGDGDMRQELQKLSRKHGMRATEVVSGRKNDCLKIIFNKMSVAIGQFKSQVGKISTYLYVKRSCKEWEFIRLQTNIIRYLPCA